MEIRRTTNNTNKTQTEQHTYTCIHPVRMHFRKRRTKHDTIDFVYSYSSGAGDTHGTPISTGTVCLFN